MCLLYQGLRALYLSSPCIHSQPDHYLKCLLNLNLQLNFDKATKEYIKRYVEKKKENMKNLKATDSESSGKEDDKKEPLKRSVEESKEDDSNETKKESDDYSTFGLVTDEDKESDREASEKLSGMIEERIKNKPLPPPPPPPQTASDFPGNSISELPAKSRDGDSDADMTRNGKYRFLIFYIIPLF